MKIKALNLNVALLLLIAFYSSQISFIQAESIDRVGNNVTVAPAKFELHGNSGDIIEQSLKITNDDDYEALYAITVENFSLTGENGEVILGQNQSEIRGDLAKWINFSDKGGIFKPHESKVIKFQILIPGKTDPGGQYAAIIISLDRVVRNHGESAASSRVVSLVMLTISGDIRDQANVESFKVTKVSSSSDFNFDLRVKNTGNNHIKPLGTITITNLFGRKVDEIPLNSENVLPGNTRLMTTTWHSPHSLFNWYTASLNSNYGQVHNMPLSSSTGFLVIPPWADVSILLLLVGGLFLYLRRMKR